MKYRRTVDSIVYIFIVIFSVFVSWSTFRLSEFHGLLSFNDGLIYNDLLLIYGPISILFLQLVYVCIKNVNLKVLLLFSYVYSFFVIATSSIALRSYDIGIISIVLYLPLIWIISFISRKIALMNDVQSKPVIVLIAITKTIIEIAYMYLILFLMLLSGLSNLLHRNLVSRRSGVRILPRMPVKNTIVKPFKV